MKKYSLRTRRNNHLLQKSILICVICGLKKGVEK